MIQTMGFLGVAVVFGTNISIFARLDLVANTIFLLQPERKKSPNVFDKIFKKESSRGKDHDSIAKEPQYVSAAKRFKPLIKIYMNILNVAFLDTTPKYIEKILVKGVSILFSE